MKLPQFIKRVLHPTFNMVIHYPSSLIHSFELFIIKIKKSHNFRIGFLIGNSLPTFSPTQDPKLET
jgi:hypothetical protein